MTPPKPPPPPGRPQNGTPATGAPIAATPKPAAAPNAPTPKPAAAPSPKPATLPTPKPLGLPTPKPTAPVSPKPGVVPSSSSTASSASKSASRSASLSDDDVLGMLGSDAGPAAADSDDDIEIPTAPSGAARAAAAKPSALSDDDILDDLDSSPAPAKPKEYRPSKSLSSEGLSLDPKERAASERNKAKIAALIGQLGGGSSQERTIADVACPVALMFIFTSEAAVQKTWEALPAEALRAMTKQLRSVNGVIQTNVGTVLSPRKLLEVIRHLKAGGGVLRTYKAERSDVQQWLTEHLK